MVFFLLGIIAVLVKNVRLVSSFSPSSLPPAPPLKSIPLPAKLAGGLFLFQTSVKKRDKDLSRQILNQAQEILRRDPLIGMELGAGLEAGGVFSSSSSVQGGFHQLVMEFQINGGNSWAQCRVRGVDKVDENLGVQIVSLSVSNMDAALNGGWADVTLPNTSDPMNEGDDGEYKLPFIEY